MSNNKLEMYNGISLVSKEKNQLFLELTNDLIDNSPDTLKSLTLENITLKNLVNTRERE